MNIYGYARVSSKDQNATLQINALKNFGVASEKIFVDRQSGKDFNRPQYKKLLRRLKSDSVFVVKSIDRLGRNYAEIIDQWRIITKEKGAAVVVIKIIVLHFLLPAALSLGISEFMRRRGWIKSGDMKLELE